MLRRIAERQETITIRDYLEALRGRASRRQASRDLASAPFLAQIGATRGTRYRLVLPAGKTRAGATRSSGA